MPVESQQPLAAIRRLRGGAPVGPAQPTRQGALLARATEAMLSYSRLSTLVEVEISWNRE